MEKLLYLLDGEGNASNAAEKLELLKEALDDLETDESQIATMGSLSGLAGFMLRRMENGCPMLRFS